jgi:uncharacterized repeat protein (TIGR03803 family)
MGAVFSEPITGGTPTLLASLDGTDGSSPTAGLILSGNTLYGTAIEGGVGSEDGIANNGTVFSVPSGGGTPTVLTNFNFVDGSGPEAALTLSGSTLYGTTYSGGYGYGEVFSLPLSGGTPTVLTSFNGTVNALGGINPSSGLIISGNKLYGTAGGGPQRRWRNIFAANYRWYADYSNVLYRQHRRPRTGRPGPLRKHILWNDHLRRHPIGESLLIPLW